MGKTILLLCLILSTFSGCKVEEEGELIKDKVGENQGPPSKRPVNIADEIEETIILLENIDGETEEMTSILLNLYEKVAEFETPGISQLANLIENMNNYQSTSKRDIFKLERLDEYDLMLGSQLYVLERARYLYYSANKLSKTYVDLLAEELNSRSAEELVELLESREWNIKFLQYFSILTVALNELVFEINLMPENDPAQLAKDEKNTKLLPIDEQNPPADLAPQKPVYKPGPINNTCNCTALKREYNSLIKAYKKFVKGIGNKFIGCLDLTQDIFSKVYRTVKPKCWGAGIAWRMTVKFNSLTCLSNFMHNAFLMYPKLANCGYRDDVVLDPYIMYPTFQTRKANIYQLTDFIIAADCGGGERDKNNVTFSVEKNRAQQCISQFGHDKSFCRGAYTCLNNEYGYDRANKTGRKKVPLKNTCP